jgi:hypothetical protein
MSPYLDNFSPHYPIHVPWIHAHVCVFQVWFHRSLRRHPKRDWSMEQKWIFALLPLLMLYNSEWPKLTQHSFLIRSQMQRFWFRKYRDMSLIIGLSSRRSAVLPRPGQRLRSSLRSRLILPGDVPVRSAAFLALRLPWFATGSGSAFAV